MKKPATARKLAVAVALAAATGLAATTAATASPTPAAVPAAAPAAPAAPSGPELAECRLRFDETVRLYNEAFAARDLATVMSYYRDDASKIDPNGDFQADKQAIGVLFGGLFQMEFESAFPAVKKTVDCETAVLITDSTLSFPAEGFQERFLSALTFTSEDDGSWRILLSASTTLPA